MINPEQLKFIEEESKEVFKNAMATILRIKQMKKLRDKQEQIDNIAKDLQIHCNKIVEDVLSHNKSISYQDATNAWLFQRLAELTYRINILENPVSIFNNILK